MSDIESYYYETPSEYYIQPGDLVVSSTDITFHFWQDWTEIIDVPYTSPLVSLGMRELSHTRLFRFYFNRMIVKINISNSILVPFKVIARCPIR